MNFPHFGNSNLGKLPCITLSPTSLGLINDPSALSCATSSRSRGCCWGHRIWVLGLCVLLAVAGEYFRPPIDDLFFSQSMSEPKDSYPRDSPCQARIGRSGHGSFSGFHGMGTWANVLQVGRRSGMSGFLGELVDRYRFSTRSHRVRISVVGCSFS